MSAPKHTPGPWSIEDKRMEHSSLRLLSIVARDPSASAESGYLEGPAHIYVAYAGNCREREDANARLIAAAPELLELVDAVADLSQEFIDGVCTPTCASREGNDCTCERGALLEGPVIAAGAARAKARGRS